MRSAVFGTAPFFSEKLKLNRHGRSGLALSAQEIDRVAELLVRHFENRHEPFVWDEALDSPDMDARRLQRRTVPNVNRILVHGKTVFQQILAELCRVMPLPLRLSGQVKHDIKPHDGVSVQCRLRTKRHANDGKASSLALPR